MDLNAGFWNKRYLEKDIPWDIGHISPPLKDLIDKVGDKNSKVLIPGAGRAFEAVYMHKTGFARVYVCDWADRSFEYLKDNTEGFPENHLICGDFFEIDDQFDLIIEQTFFCSLHPGQRSRYVQQVNSLLKEGGTLAGLFFASHFERPGPPFGGTEKEYRMLFEPFFDIEIMEASQNSILPRLGNELYFKMKKK